MGSIFRLPTTHGMTPTDAIAFARRQRLQVVVADGAGRRPHDVDLRRPTLLVVGAEAAGVASEWLEAADEHVRIPLREPVESLNVTDGGVLLFEAQRQRTGHEPVRGSERGRGRAAARPVGAARRAHATGELDEYLGQDKLLGDGRALRAAIEQGVTGSPCCSAPWSARRRWAC